MGAVGGGADVAVAVPLGLAVAEPDAVDHAVAHEPVMGRRVDRIHRVGAVAQVAAVEIGRELADDLQVEGGQLLGDGGVVAREVGAGVDGSHVDLLIRGGDVTLLRDVT